MNTVVCTHGAYMDCPTRPECMAAARCLQPADAVDHPPHYNNHPSGVECIDVVRHMNFNRGNAIKYIWRAGSKGDEVTDLRKARWYLDDEIRRLDDAQKY